MFLLFLPLIVVIGRVVGGLSLLVREFLLGDGVLRMFLQQVLVVNFVNFLFLIPNLLPLLLLLDHLHFFLGVEIHLPDVKLFVVLDYLLLRIHDSHLLFNAAKLVSQDAIDLISVLGVEVVLVRHQLTL